MTTANRITRVMPIRAVQCFRRMPGRCQSQLMGAADGKFYVVKFPNNPQGVRILANEMLGAALAAFLGVPTPPVAVIEVPERTVFLSEGMFIEIARSRVPCQPGLCFGSQRCLDERFWLPDMITPESVENPADFLGMLVFDKWSGNTDGRQIALLPNDHGSSHKAIMIDQGLCFGGNEWAFHDAPLRGIAHFPRIYESVTGLKDFEPWLTRLETQVDFEMLCDAANAVPPQWYMYDESALGRLIYQLNKRRMLVRGMVSETLRIAHDLFPNVPHAKSAGKLATA